MRYLMWPVLVASVLAMPALASDCPTAPLALQQFLEGDGWGTPGNDSILLHDLDGDGAPEAVILLEGPEWCGSGGCTLLVAGQQSGAWSLISKTTLVHPPVRVLPRGPSGWASLAANAGGGGVDFHPVILDAHDGRYPGNASTLPAADAPALPATACTITGGQ